MKVDETDAVVRLVQGNMVGRVGYVGLDGNRCFVLSVDWGGAAVDGLVTLLEVLLDEALFIILVDDRLTIRDEGSHDEDGELEEVGGVESE